MKVTRLTVYRVLLTQWKVKHRYSEHMSVDAPYETSLVRLETDVGLTGWGETCTALSYYLPTLPAGAREAIKFAAPMVLGTDPRALRSLLHRLGLAMRGQKPAKSALEMALWDIAGQSADLPLCDLWGGRIADSMPVLAMISIDQTDQMIESIRHYRERGYFTFQVKLEKADPAENIDKIRTIQEEMRAGERCWFDANRGWTIHDCMQVLPQVKDLGVLMEQPCETYRECRIVSRRLGMGLMLDESIDGPDTMLRAIRDGVMDAATLKFNSTGGISSHRLLAELGVHYGVPMRIEDFFGTGLTMAAVTHIAQTLPEEATLGLYDYHLDAVPVALNPIPVEGGRTRIPAEYGPGLGVQVNEEILGEPEFVCEA